MHDHRSFLPLGHIGRALVAGSFAATAALAASLVPGDRTFRIQHGGISRSYLVHIPAGLKGPAPLVIAFHGGGSNAEAQSRYSGMNGLADRERFIVGYPNGTGRGRMLVWNAGTCCGSAPAKKIDDVGFTRAMINDLARRVSVDRSRVYATGFSNGAMMAYRIGAEAPDLVAAIAPVSGSMVLARFKPARAVPVMHIHSVDDPRALYEGGLGPPFPVTGVRNLHPPVEEQLAKWAAHNKCQASPRAEKQLAGEEGKTATKYVYTPCASGAPVILWKLTGSGHVWPGTDVKLKRLLGEPTHLIDANEEIWEFFKSRKR